MAPYRTGRDTASRTAVSRVYQSMILIRMEIPRIAAPHDIAEAPDGVDQLMGEGLVHLVAQVPDVHVHDVGVVVEVEIPHMVGNLGAGQGLLLMAQQILQQGVLLGGQRQCLPGPVDGFARRVHDQIVQLQNGVAHLALAPEQGPNPGQKLVKRKGLHQIIVRPGVQPGHPVLDGVLGCEQQHVGMVPAAPQPAEQRQPVHLGQHPVQDNTVIVRRLRVVQAVPAVEAAVHRVALLRQPLGQNGIQRHIVFND